ncbi:MAG TPA: penicillin-binding protein 1C [Spirochaetia bacterium]|nr:penicillin-binding protein 1C [Spirochaetales bacterium]HRY80381.1 penicillin-binding protein 1C [Spirochaetia bacterium]
MSRRESAPVAAGAVLLAALVLLVPGPPRFPGGYSTVLYDRNGLLLGAAAAPDGQWRFPPAPDLPDRYVRALVAFEDRRFFGHAGFDPRALARALVSNLAAGRIVSGGSTLSMQAARMARGNRPRNLGQKALELLYALRLEAFRGKRGILALYAAHAPFGGNVVGLAAASWRYFGRPPEDLTWAEAAVLAVLPNSPALVHPGADRDRLREKRDALLMRLAERGELGPEDLAAARAEPIPDRPEPLPRKAPHLLSRAVRDGLAGTRVDSTLDGGLQDLVARTAARHGARLASRGIRNAAVIVAEIESGEILAYLGNLDGPEGGEDREAARWVDCAAAPRSTGSILKPFLYAALLDGGDLSPTTLVPDLPTSFGSFSPENNTRTYSGAVPAERALAHSLNVPFVRLLRTYGVDAFLALLKGYGFSELGRTAGAYGLTLVLGGAEATLWDSASAYADLARSARGLEGVPAFAYSRTPPAPRGSGSVPASPGAAYLTLRALLEVGRPAEESAWKDWAEGRRIAWKTGTSQGFRDAWALGVTSEHLVAVWVGNATGEGRPELRGSEAAAPLLFDVFELLPRDPWIDPPPDALRRETVCADSGYLAGPDCARTLRIDLPSGAPPPDPCPYCRTIHLTADGAFRATADCVPLDRLVSRKVFVLPPALEWYFRAGHPAYRPLPPVLPGCGTVEDIPVTVLVPEEGARLFIPVELDGTPGRAVFRAVHRDPRARLFWHLDGDYLGETTGPEHRLEVRPARGRSVLTVVDQEGRTSTRRFEVLSEREGS